MPIDAYSWRENQIVPMLDEDEWQSMEPLLHASVTAVKTYRAENGCNLAEAKLGVETEMERRYFELTGTKVPSYESIYYPRRSNYGRFCPTCSKPFRTPKAPFCAECGHKN